MAQRIIYVSILMVYLSDKGKKVYEQFYFNMKSLKLNFITQSIRTNAFILFNIWCDFRGIISSLLGGFSTFVRL